MWKCCTSNCVHKWSILLQQWHTCTSAAWVYEGHHDSSTPSSFGSYSFGMFPGRVKAVRAICWVTNYAHLALPRKTLRMTRINLSVITPWKPVDLHSVFFQLLPYLQAHQDRAYNSNPKCRRDYRWRGKRSIAPWEGDNEDNNDASEVFNVSSFFIHVIIRRRNTCQWPMIRRTLSEADYRFLKGRNKRRSKGYY